MHTQTPVNHAMIRLSLRHLKRLKQRQRDYDEAVRDWYRSGDGRSPNWRTEVEDDGSVRRWNAGGSGYRFPECIHGMSSWTDYDNICGPCEDGLSVYEQALALGHADWDEWMRRVEVCNQTSLARVPAEIQQQLIEWALSVLEEGW